MGNIRQYRLSKIRHNRKIKSKEKENFSLKGKPYFKNPLLQELNEEMNKNM